MLELHINREDEALFFLQKKKSLITHQGQVY